MAFDPKVAAGGVAVVAIGGGAGVAIHQGTTSSSQEQTTKKSGIELAIENAGFTLETTKTTECETELKKTLDDSNYKAAVVACAKEKTFKERAIELGLTVLDIKEIDSQFDTGVGKNKGTAKNTIIKTLDSNSTNGTKASDAAAKTKIEEVCSAEANIKITTGVNNEKGHKFLNICVKEDEDSDSKKPLANALKKDFGTNDLTVEAKLENLGFAITKTESGCSAKLDKLENSNKLKEIVEVCYKSKKFSDRAKALNLEVLTTDNYSNDGGKDVGTPHKETMKSEVTNNQSKDGNDAKEEVKTYCTETSGPKGNKTIDKNTDDDNGKKFLKVCTKDKTGDTGKKAKVESRDFGSIVKY